VQSIRKRREKILFGPYVCPYCNQEKLRIIINEDTQKVLAVCNCGLKKNLEYKLQYSSIDYYNELIDEG
jgi:transcription elongation factor Elf1